MNSITLIGRLVGMVIALTIAQTGLVSEQRSESVVLDSTTSVIIELINGEGPWEIPVLEIKRVEAVHGQNWLDVLLIDVSSGASATQLVEELTPRIIEEHSDFAFYVIYTNLEEGCRGDEFSGDHGATSLVICAKGEQVLVVVGNKDRTVKFVSERYMNDHDEIMPPEYDIVTD